MHLGALYAPAAHTAIFNRSCSNKHFGAFLPRNGIPSSFLGMLLILVGASKSIVKSGEGFEIQRQQV
jgi:hypothetical protein